MDDPLRPVVDPIHRSQFYCGQSLRSIRNLQRHNHNRVRRRTGGRGANQHRLGEHGQRKARRAPAGTRVLLSERIGHADVGFFLQTYAHVITNDDREAAEQAASFLIGDGWDPEPDDKQG